jgi:outer membrane lipoprotein carrier protein
MSRRFIALACLALGAAMPAGALAQQQPPQEAPAEPNAAEIGERVQRFYDSTKTFQAKFRQVYKTKVQNVTKVSTGKVAFAKKGKLSFRYDSPAGNRVVSDGTVIRIYEKENQQMYETKVGKSQYPAALAFLEGSGKLTRDFELRKLDAAKMNMKNGFVLEAIPKEATPAYKKLILYVDGATSQVRRVLVLDEQGNKNRFDFERPVINQPVADSEFQFVPPPGTNVVRP